MDFLHATFKNSFTPERKFFENRKLGFGVQIISSKTEQHAAEKSGEVVSIYTHPKNANLDIRFAQTAETSFAGNLRSGAQRSFRPQNPLNYRVSCIHSRSKSQGGKSSVNPPISKSSRAESYFPI